MTRRLIIAIYIMCGVALAGRADVTADSLLDRVIEWMSAKRTIEIDYTISAGDNRAAGTIVSDGHRFRIKSDILDTWFDGTTQWTYSPDTREVTVIEPTDEELRQVNPFAIIDRFRSEYIARLKPTQPGASHVIEMTPRDGSDDIRRAEIIVPAGHNYPARIVIWGASGDQLVIDTARLIRGSVVSAADFTFTPADRPDAAIVDLR